MAGFYASRPVARSLNSHSAVTLRAQLYGQTVEIIPMQMAYISASSVAPSIVKLTRPNEPLQTCLSLPLTVGVIAPLMSHCCDNIYTELMYQVKVFIGLTMRILFNGCQIKLVKFVD